MSQPNELKIVDNFSGADYTNAAQFNHNKEEFQLVFLNIAAGSGRVSSKLVTTPNHFKRLVIAMQDNLKKYEDVFGKIDENKDPHKDIDLRGKGSKK